MVLQLEQAGAVERQLQVGAEAGVEREADAQREAVLVDQQVRGRRQLAERRRHFLAQRGYRVAPVTVDYADYTFAGVFRNQLRGGNAEVAAKIKDAYLNQVDVGFEYAEKTSIELFGYELPQILLIHCNELNSLTLRDSIARLRKRGYAFITLDEAMKDPAYERPDTSQALADRGCRARRR